MLHLPRRIREARSRAGLSQVELAAAAAVSQGTVSKWELGRQVPSIAQLEAIAEATGTRPATLLGEPVGVPDPEGLRAQLDAQAGRPLTEIEWRRLEAIIRAALETS